MAEFQRKCWLDITGIERVLREILTKKVHLKVEQKNNDTRKLMSRGNSTLKKTSDLLHGRGDVNRHFLEFINYLEENKDEKVSIIKVQERFREIQELCDGFTKEFSIS